ncbi:MAG: hypothetical protein SOU82_02720 [Alloprevotella sp.]|nr:hypothetical protein [Alloprevotella sp.]
MLLNFTPSKRYVAFLFAVAMSLTQMVVAQQQPATGDGTSANPFEISTAEQLAWFRDYVNGTYTPADGETATTHVNACAKLIDNIDLSSVCSASLGISWTPIESYEGTFDGNHKTIANLYINATTDNVGFFSRLFLNANIKDLSFSNVDITNTGQNTGTLAGYLQESQNISRIAVLSGSVTGSSNYTGGIVGDVASAKLADCHNRASVTGAYATGGICGEARLSTIISNCSNYGRIVDTSTLVGGIVGNVQYSSLSNCANYGEVKGSSTVGGLCGRINGDEPVHSQLTNVASFGNVTAESSSRGLLIGSIGGYTNLSGHCFFNKEATLTNDGSTVESVACSDGTPISGSVTGYTAEQLQSGAVTWWLQNQIGATEWGQKIGVNDFPVLGQADQVYATGTITGGCTTGYTGGGSFANTEFETPATLSITHGTATHHDAVAATCTTDGTVAYWECGDCHKAYADEALTTAIADITIPALGHQFGEDGTCQNGCGLSYPKLNVGSSTIQIAAVSGDEDELSGYNLYLFVAPATGTLTVKTVGDEDTYGTLWNIDGTTRLIKNDDGGEGGNFKYSYPVTAGTSYLIGVREYYGNEIGDYTIFLSGEWPVTVDAMTLTDATEYEQPSVGGKPVVTNFTYKRNFTHTKWQPLYVPFAIKSSEVLPQGIELACINNFHEYEDAEGQNKVVLEIKKVTSGILHPNTPFLIRAIESGEKNITMTNVTLEEAQFAWISCASVTRNYYFNGTYRAISAGDLDASYDYTMTEGVLYHPEGTLSPQRWYLSTEDREAIIDAESSEAPRSIEVRVIGEGEVTAIEDVTFITTPATDKAEGLYDLQGRRLDAEPARGVYVKNGQKTIR